MFATIPRQVLHFRCALTFCLLVTFGGQALGEQVNDFGDIDLVGNTFHVTESSYSYDITFTSANQGSSTGGVGYFGPGEVFPYAILNGAINIPDPEGFTAGSRYTLIDPDTFMVRQEVFPGPFEVIGGYPGIDDFAVFNNSATALKDFFLANGLWESTITADGQIIHPTRPAIGEWWIESNTFYFNYPDPDNDRGTDAKAYKLQDDILYFRTDAGSTIDSNWQLVPEPATISLLALGGLALIRRRRAV